MLSNNEYGDGPKKSSKQNRKSGKVPDDNRDGDEYEENLNLDSQDIKSNLSKSGNGIQPKPSKKGGWALDSKSKKRNEDADFEDDRLRPSTQPQNDGGADSDPDIPFIPELEAGQTSRGGRVEGQVAMAPNVAVNRVATYKELDNELLKHSTFLTLDNDIDLKLLAKGLLSEAEVIEEDVAWQWDHLYAEVTSDLLTEWENQEQGQEKTGA